MSSVQPLLNISLDSLLAFSHRTFSLVTVDAPLFGTFLIFNGRVTSRGTIVEAEKIGQTVGYPAPERILVQACRFWIQHPSGIRERKNRKEMVQILDEK
jgi:hypothetical protein